MTRIAKRTARERAVSLLPLIHFSKRTYKQTQRGSMPFVGAFTIIAKNTYVLRHDCVRACRSVRPSVCWHEISRLPLDALFLDFAMGKFTDICLQNLILFKIGKSWWTFYTKIHTHILKYIDLCSVPLRVQLYASVLLMRACIRQLHDPVIWEATQADVVVQQRSAFSAVKLPFKIALTPLGNPVRRPLQLLSTVILTQFSGQDTAVQILL
jgi:hypothetical protein